MKETIESLIRRFKGLKQRGERVAIDPYVSAQSPDIREELAPRLYFHMFEWWLRKVTKQSVIDWARKWRRRIDLTDSIDDATEDENPFIHILVSPANPEEELIAKEIIAAIEKLSERQGLICKHYYSFGYTDREIGEMLDMKRNTVTVQRRRAIEELREILRKWGY